MLFAAVTYHYFAPDRPEAPRAIFPVTPAELDRQLELLGRTFEFVSRDDIVRAVRGERSLPERACAITFDDGLRCQFDLALPVLERHGVPGIFFVTGAPLIERRVLHVHRVHWVRERIDDAALWETAHLEVSRAPDAPAFDALNDAEATYRYDSPAAARVKFLLQFGLPRELRERITERVFRETGGDEEELFRALYMERGHVLELERRGALGAHALTHHALGPMAPAEARYELQHGAAILEAVTGTRPLLLSYPYGVPGAVTVETARAAAESGFVAAFTTERDLNRSFAKPFLLSRIDTNDAPGGRQPLLRVDGATVSFDGVDPRRTPAFDEASAPDLTFDPVLRSPSP